MDSHDLPLSMAMLQRHHLKESNVLTRIKKKTADKRQGSYDRNPCGWALYKQHIAARWRAKLNASNPLSKLKLIQQGRRKVKSHKYLRRKYVTKGRWTEWKAFEAKLVDKYKASAAVRTVWRARASVAKAKKLDGARKAAEEVRVAKQNGKSCKLEPEQSFWQCGDHEHPCSFGLLAKAVQECRGPLQPGVMSVANEDAMLGPVTAADMLRYKQAESYMIPDPIPPGRRKLKALHVPETCFGKHPGLCVQADADTKDHVVKIICNLSTLVSGRPKFAVIGSVVVFTFETQNRFLRSCVMIGNLRMASPKFQQFVQLAIVEQDDGGVPLRVRLLSAGQEQFRTCYAAEFLTARLREAVAKLGLDSASRILRVSMQHLATDLELPDLHGLHGIHGT